MRFSKEIDQALRSLSYLGKEKRSLSAREISKNQNIPYEKLCKILQKLSSGKIIHAQRGRQGGYSLSLPLNKLTIAELHSVLGENKNIVPCTGSRGCDVKNCNLKSGFARFQDDLNKLLSDYTVEDITGAV